MAIRTGRESGSESIVGSVGRLAIVVLTTFELAEASSTFVVAPVTIVWGVGLLLCGAAVLSQMNVLPGKYLATEGDFASFSTGWSTVFLAGFVGTVLGVLARLGVSWTQLVVAAVIAHCGFMVISSNASLRMPILCGDRQKPIRLSLGSHTHLE
jgi:hypothetical protein